MKHVCRKCGDEAWRMWNGFWYCYWDWYIEASAPKMKNPHKIELNGLTIEQRRLALNMIPSVYSNELQKLGDLVFNRYVEIPNRLYGVRINKDGEAV